MSKIQLKSQLVRAGAGTGKTTCLVKEVYDLFKIFREREGRSPQLIVCTFTRKACGELKVRLFEKAQEELAERNKQRIKSSPLKGENQDPKETMNNPISFLNYVQSPSLHIATIDGILNMFLKRYGHKLDLSPDFQLCHTQASEKLFDSLAEEFVFERNFALLQKIPYPFLKELFLFYFKLRMKYGKIAFYNEKDFETFNQERSLFLSAEQLLKKQKGEYPDGIKIKKPFEEKESPFAKLLNKYENEDKVKSLFKEEESFTASAFVPIFKEFHQAAEKFFLSFMEEKKKSAVLDMDDLLLLSLTLLRENPQTAQYFSKEWDYWLIDEYQDTSWIQEQIIDRITGFRNVFCVGDPAQSVYLFRNADPHVFKRREKTLGKGVQKLDINYRSSANLIYFYNDFFSADKGFMKFNPPPNKSILLDKPCVYFLTYEKNRDRKKQYKQKALKALYCYIQKLIAEGSSYSEIAVLSSKNDDLVEIADYLRSRHFPLMLHGSKNFAQKRVILDALFLLKFLINPYDDTNLKALLRTPYFCLSDQDLADSCHDHFEFCKNKESISFWSFIKDNFSDKILVKSLDSYLYLKKKRGLIQSFEKALMDSGFMDLSYFQDPTGSSESNLWKLIYLLNQNNFSALELFYSLGKEKSVEENEQEAPSCDNNESIELMTIHKSKGLEFKHVIVMDFSIGRSSLKSGNTVKDLMIYDEIKHKMAFAVPIGGRDKKTVKSYGHKIYNKSREKENMLERERLFYVAMTRAKQSLALFIPHSPPERNSWLDTVCFFKEFAVSNGCCPLLEEKYDEKNKNKLKSWRLNKGHYKTRLYSFCVQTSESICQSPEEFISSSKGLKSSCFSKDANQREPDRVLTGKEKHFETVSIQETRPLQKLKKDKTKKNDPITAKKRAELEPALKLKIKSSQDFIKETTTEDKLSEEKSFYFQKRQNISGKNSKKRSKERPDKNIQTKFSFFKAKNTVFKASLGHHLHFFLQRLAHQSFEKTMPLIDKISLSKKDKEQIEQALIYTIQLKDPPINLFLKTGFPEWPFKMKKQNALLQGQIDLWAWDSHNIHVFDYKSSLSLSPQTKKQLIFYSWILDQFYHPKSIIMSEVYPFQQMIHQSVYNPSHKSLFENWLNKIHDS